MLQKPSTVEDIALACAVLHNFIRRKHPETEDSRLVDREDPATYRVIPGDWRLHTVTPPSLGSQRGNRATFAAKQMREYLKQYYTSTGAVSWQEDMI
jgi:hypothetical protein